MRPNAICKEMERLMYLEQTNLQTHDQGNHAHRGSPFDCSRAEAGEVEAQFNLGGAYLKGEGVPQNNVEAIRWWRKAAEQGHAKAQYALGYAYNNGHGVPQNYREAVQWFTKAAEQGNAGAQFALGIAYFDGQDVKRDFTEAYIWFSLAKVGLDQMAAAAEASQTASELIGALLNEMAAAAEASQTASELIGALLNEMTPAQIQKAQDLALERFNRIETRKAQNR